MRAACILPAAGLGTRMGADIPKPFLPLAGTPAVIHAVERVRRAVELVACVLVLPASWLDGVEARYGAALRAAGVTAMVPGGAARQESVARGLAALGTDCDVVLVHDAVRPFPSARMIRECCAAALENGGALPVLPITDTIKRLDGDCIGQTVPREGLYAVQTPQVFRRELLAAAYRNPGRLDASVTDDAMLVEAIGGRVRAIAGDRFNIKLTTPEDLRIAEAWLAAGIVSE
mgnify:CR=1 FL=1